MDWLSSGRHDRFEYVQVTRPVPGSPEMKRVKDLDIFQDGGSIEYNDQTDIKVTGSLPFVEMPEIGSDYVRIYSISELGGVVQEILHGTFIIATPSSTIAQKVRTGSADMYSLLLILKEACLITPLSIPAGTHAISYAISLIEEVLMQVISDESSYTLSIEKTFDAGTSFLEVINDLCLSAGFCPANIDPYGRVLLLAYKDPAKKTADVVLRDDSTCVFASEVSHELDIYDVPNVFVAILTNEEKTHSVTVKNEDGNSPFSRVNKGRSIVHVEKVKDVDATSDEEILDELEKKALSSAYEETGATESVEIEHVWVPLQVGQTVRIEYQHAQFSFTGIAHKKSMDLKPGMWCKTSLRRLEQSFMPTIERG